MIAGLSGLQIGLIVFGVVLVLGVLFYNHWEERRAKRRAERAFATDADHGGDRTRPAAAGPAQSSPVGVADERREPIGAQAEPPFGPDVSTRSDEVAGVAGASDSEVTTDAAANTDCPAFPDEFGGLDGVISLRLAAPMAEGGFMRAAREALSHVDKPLRWYGWARGESGWTLLHGEGTRAVYELRAAVQLADRRGALSEAGWRDIARGVERLADRLLAVAVFPDSAELLERARGLDRFAASVDVQIGLNVLSRTQVGFSGQVLRQLLEREGLSQRTDGLYQATDANGANRFTLGNLDAQALARDGLDALTLRGLTLMLDVPRAQGGAEAFDAMLACAQRLAHELDARVVDDTEAELAPEALSVIRTRIVEFQQVMSQHGIPAGSGMALRLFA